MNGRRSAIVGLFVVLLFDIWWRCHTISGSIRDLLGFAPYPVVAEGEPLDCDEALYAYIGKRIVAGDAMYRDLTEFKPPLGYWIYALAVRVGGPTELAIRLMPIPFVLVTIVLIWWVAWRMSGAIAAVSAAFLFAIMSTDPYVYGNGANMEHFMNLFSTAALALTVRFWTSKNVWPWVAIGILIGAASLVKQVAALPLILVVFGILGRGIRGDKRSTILTELSLVSGFVIVWAFFAGSLLIQGSFREFYQDVFEYSRALATETPADSLQRPFFVRWLVGNTDPQGVLPWPFDKTDGRAWWGAGLWPLWAASLPVSLWGLIGQNTSRRLVALWIAVGWLEVALPGLFWQHYYMLPLPGMAILFGVAVGQLAPDGIHTGKLAKFGRLILPYVTVLATLATIVIQSRDYLLVTPDRVTTRCKGGLQWVVLRRLGKELGIRSRDIASPRLFVWGIHSPLYFYSGIDGVTRQLFTDPLMLAEVQGLVDVNPKVQALLAPRKERTVADLQAMRPDLIFLGAPPFPTLKKFVTSEYAQVRDFLPGLFVRNDRLEAFRAAGRR